MKRLYQLIQNERGAVGVIMAILLVVVLGFVAFGVDVGLLREKRAHLQKAADIAALAGGRSLLVSGSDLDEPTAEAVEYGRANLDTNDVPTTALQDSDVTYYLDGTPDTTSPNEIEVQISRTTDRGNSLSTIFGSVLDVDEFDVTAASRVQIASVCSSKCLKPFSAPDKFTFTDLDGDGELDVDDPLEMQTVVVQGYSESDLGTQIILKFGNPQDTLVPGQASAIDLPPVNKGDPVSGASAYRDNIAGCEGSNSLYAVEIGDELLLEPGMMIGPTKQGIDDLIALDANAVWSDTENTVINSIFPTPLESPRVVIIAFYNPLLPPASGRNTVFVNYLGAVFIEGLTGNDVTGRFIRGMAAQPVPGNGSGDCLIYTLKFVKDSSRQ
ncbi:TadE/TadG family type IV pilus assembly protein [Halodesulfovibrio marinisediminis]|uniref:Flp pilus assembly protein TadG n=1 Tax=Halodesulfovibrio marinisediminis DSM 17456 TaxID=1121457 RepID=A0A1N6EAB5_9BACT|nr:TadE/TadG family type IV pilus assembly protein [Halodesulfovibrio marinisediminis]SIN79936.1 Flp pilus assembly protein TadG [Halodesulfovibrio marinisediminis DSM 17456]